MRIIDSHLHLFNLSQGDYHWLKPDQPPYWPGKSALARDYGESDLQLPPDLQLAGFVHIEAGFDNRQPWREIAWLEQHCQVPFRSVGFADMNSDDFVHIVEQQLDYASLVGIRNIVANDALGMLKSPRTAGYLDFLVEHNLILELQLDLQHSEALTSLLGVADRWPALTIVLNHAGLTTAVSPAWRAAIRALADRPNCIVKCSGWEMLQRDWSVQSVSPVISFLLETLPVSRLMLASNFPVSELSCSYTELWQRYADLLGVLLPAELFFDTARQVYGFDEL